MQLLNPNQELYALGAGNILGCIASSYPVTGSYSRSALNHASGARTPMSKVTSMSIVLLTLGALTQYFYYIPSSALAAIVWVAIYNLLSFQDFYDAWKFSKKDLFVMTTAFVFTFVLDTSIGLAIGISASFLVHLYDVVFALKSLPQRSRSQVEYIESSEDNKVIAFNGDITFLSAPGLQDYFTNEFVIDLPTLTKQDTEMPQGEYYFQLISQKLDKVLLPKRQREEGSYLAGIYTLDFSNVIHIDLSGLIILQEIFKIARLAKVKLHFINLRENIALSIRKYGLKSDFNNSAEVLEALALLKVDTGLFLI
jgi:anti-anti-sigma regulatory factor